MINRSPRRIINSFLRKLFKLAWLRSRIYLHHYLTLNRGNPNLTASNRCVQIDRDRWIYIFAFSFELATLTYLNNKNNKNIYGIDVTVNRTIKSPVVRPIWFPFPLNRRAYSSVTPAGTFNSSSSVIWTALEPWHDPQGWVFKEPEPEQLEHVFVNMNPFRIFVS